MYFFLQHYYFYFSKNISVILNGTGLHLTEQKYKKGENEWIRNVEEKENQEEKSIISIVYHTVWDGGASLAWTYFHNCATCKITMLHSDKSHKSLNINLLFLSLLLIYSEDKHRFRSWGWSHSLQVAVPWNQLLTMTLLQLLLMSGFKAPSPVAPRYSCLRLLLPCCLFVSHPEIKKSFHVAVIGAGLKIRSENEDNISLLIRNNDATHSLFSFQKEYWRIL